MDLYIASGRHFDGVGGRAEAALPALDVVFVEAPDRQVGPREYLAALGHAPLLVVTAHLWQSALGAGSTAVDPRRRAVDVVPVDVPHASHVYERRRLWAIPNWVAVGWPIAAGIDPWSLTYLAAVLLQAVVVFGAYVAATVPYRDRYIAARIADHADDYAVGRLEIGSGHHEGVARHLAGIDGVRVHDPISSGERNRAARTADQ